MSFILFAYGMAGFFVMFTLQVFIKSVRRENQGKPFWGALGCGFGALALQFFELGRNDEGGALAIWACIFLALYAVAKGDLQTQRS